MTDARACDVMDRWRDPGSERRPCRYCDECGKPTKEGKPYCAAHVLRMPYAAEVRERVEEREREAKKARAGKRPRQSDALTGEVLWALRHRDVAPHVLARELDVPPVFVDRAIELLERAERRGRLVGGECNTPPDSEVA